MQCSSFFPLNYVCIRKKSLSAYYPCFPAVRNLMLFFSPIFVGISRRHHIPNLTTSNSPHWALCMYVTMYDIVPRIVHIIINFLPFSPPPHPESWHLMIIRNYMIPDSLDIININHNIMYIGYSAERAFAD